MDTHKWLRQVEENPLLLFKDTKLSKKLITEVLVSTFQSKNELVFSGFGVEQVWQQIEHHTAKSNQRVMNKVASMLSDDAFIDMLQGDLQEEAKGIKSKKSKKSKKDKDYAFERDDEVGEEEEGISADYGAEEESGEAEEMEEMEEEMEEPEGSIAESDLDARMQDMEEDELQDLKMPEGLEDDEESEDEGLFPPDDGKDFPQFEKDLPAPDQSSDGEDAMEDVFAAANDNEEMDILQSMRRKAESGETFVNADLFKKMDLIEHEMINPKQWELLGEARASERPKDSLLAVHLDFNTVTKQAPIINIETTNAIDSLIKQRVLDELFDDPILKAGGTKRRKLDAADMDFA